MLLRQVWHLRRLGTPIARRVKWAQSEHKLKKLDTNGKHRFFASFSFVLHFSSPSNKVNISIVAYSGLDFQESENFQPVRPPPCSTPPKSLPPKSQLAQFYCTPLAEGVPVSEWETKESMKAALHCANISPLGCQSVTLNAHRMRSTVFNRCSLVVKFRVQWLSDITPSIVWDKSGLKAILDRVISDCHS